MQENMNDGKSFAFFDWAFKHALVPPQPSNLTSPPSIPDSSSNDGYGRRSPRPHPPFPDESMHGWAMHNAYDRRPPAPHDPISHNRERFTAKDGWTRPEFVVKADDDSFIMLAELEARLRVLDRKGVYWGCEDLSFYCLKVCADAYDGIRSRSGGQRRFPCGRGVRAVVGSGRACFDVCTST